MKRIRASKPKQQFANFRTPEDIKRDRAVIKTMLKRKVSERNTTAMLNARTDVAYKLSRSQVHLDIVAIRANKKSK